MRINLIAVGTVGDIHPVVAVASALQGHGYKVRLCSHALYQNLVREHDLEFFDLQGGNPKEIVRDVHRTSSKWSFTRRLVHYYFQSSAPSAGNLDRLIEACEDCDALISSVVHAYHVAEAKRKPYVQLALYPIHVTTAFPHFLSRTTMSLGGIGNRLSHLLIHRLFWQRDRKWINQWRTQRLHLAPESYWGIHSKLSKNQIPCLYGFSPSVIPHPRDWRSDCHITGYWFLDEFKQWSPAPDLLKFLENGPAPLGIAFGSVIEPRAAEFQRILLGAIAATKQRAILMRGWGESAHMEKSPEIYWADWIPFSWLLPKLQGVIHHGGAGSSSHILRAGLPSVTVPYSGEHLFWASRLFHLGVAPRPIPRKHLTERRLADAISQICLDQQYRRKAAPLREAINSENGVQEACKWVDYYLRSPGRKQWWPVHD